MSDIKPCPFCGNDKIEYDSSSGAWFIGCKPSCTLGFVDSKNAYADDIIRQWNKRPVEEALQVRLSRAEELLDEAIDILHHLKFAFDREHPATRVGGATAAGSAHLINGFLNSEKRQLYLEYKRNRDG